MDSETPLNLDAFHVAAPMGARTALTSLSTSEYPMNNIYKHIELTGTSSTSIEDAIQGAVTRASKSVRNMRWMQVLETRGHINQGKVDQWQVTIKVGFTLEE